VLDHRRVIVGTGRPADDGAQRLPASERDPALGVAAVRHDGSEAQDSLRVLRGEHLPDHAAHRGAHDVHALEPERVEQPDGVGRHVLETVGRRDRPAQQRPADGAKDVRHRHALEAGRAAAVAVVEGDDAQALVHQGLHELVGPEGRGHAEPHDQQQRRRGGVATQLVVDRQAVGLERGHGRSAAFTWPGRRRRP
jgi:hypothetical protein